MTKNRLEAFSDGVIAILITIMVLGLTVPVGDQLGDLWHLRYVFIGYVLSFLYLAIYWNNHHHMLSVTGRVTGGVLWANMHLLFWLSLVPFVTFWMGKNTFAHAPTAVYGVVLLMAAIAYFILQRVIIRSQGEKSLLAEAVGRDLKGKASPILYAIAIAMAFVQPWVAYGIYVLVALMWIIPDRRIEQAVGAREAAGEVHDPVGDDPHERDQHVDAVGDPRLHERHRDGDGVEDRRRLALEVPADGLGEQRPLPLAVDDDALQDVVGDGRHQQHHAVQRGGGVGEAVLPHPAGDERHQREPEQQVHVGPEHAAGDAPGDVQHVMVVVPVDGEVGEAQHVADEHVPQPPQVTELVAVRDREPQHHDRDEDGDDAVAESFEPVLRHAGAPGCGSVRSQEDLALRRSSFPRSAVRQPVVVRRPRGR